MSPQIQSCNGVSVIICGHNSTLRLPATLAHLSAQQTPVGLPWEVVVVDNASTDDTVDVARLCWPSPAPAPLRVISEPRLGKMNAFQRGCEAARYEVLAFLDDDNWAAPDWLATAHCLMSESPEMGACGGFIEAVCEVPAPEWFEVQSFAYAVGVQKDGMLWGAGMIMRRAAWIQLVENGFRSVLSCRKGDQLTAGGDSELCYALRMVGWAVRYEPKLRLQHFMPAGRLTVGYLRRLWRGFGESTVVLRAYEAALSAEPPFQPGRFTRKHWQAELRPLLNNLWSFRKAALRTLFAHEAIHLDETISMEFLFGKIRGYLRWRGRFDVLVEQLQKAPWRFPGRHPSHCSAK